VLVCSTSHAASLRSIDSLIFLPRLMPDSTSSSWLFETCNQAALCPRGQRYRVTIRRLRRRQNPISSGPSIAAQRASGAHHPESPDHMSLIFGTLRITLPSPLVSMIIILVVILVIIIVVIIILVITPSFSRLVRCSPKA
jgi:hypothetical protein